MCYFLRSGTGNLRTATEYRALPELLSVCMCKHWAAFIQECVDLSTFGVMGSVFRFLLKTSNTLHII